MEIPVVAGGVESPIVTAGDVALLPRRLSPSRAKDFLDCPQLFYQRSVLRLPSPPTAAQVRGTLVHAVLERIFDEEPDRRTAAVAAELVEPCWAAMIDQSASASGRPSQADAYRALFPAGSDAEDALLKDALAALVPWFDMERAWNFDPRNLALPDGRLIDGRELYVDAETSPGLHLHGYIDRVDRWQPATGAPAWFLSDYKTSSRIPGTTRNGDMYGPTTVARIRHEAFFALRVYALLAHDSLGVTPEKLRLIYTPTGDRHRGILTATVTAAQIEQTRAEMADLWSKIVEAARAGRWPCSGGYRCTDHQPVDA